MCVVVSKIYVSITPSLSNLSRKLFTEAAQNLDSHCILLIIRDGIMAQPRRRLVGQAIQMPHRHCGG